MVLVILIKNHHQSGGIIGSRLRYNLPGSYRMQPIFEIVRSQIVSVKFKINDNGVFAKKEVIVKGLPRTQPPSQSFSFVK